MNIYLLKENKTKITNSITNVTLSGEYRSCCRCLSFGIINNQEDKNTHLYDIQVGDYIQLEDDGQILFLGIVWSKNKATNTNEISMTCYDLGIYLKKNRYSYKFKNITPENIVRKIASEFDIELGEIATTNKSISKKFLGENLFNVISKSYGLANDKKYVFMFKAKKFTIFEIGTEYCEDIKSSYNLLTSNVSETLNNMVNRVSIFDKNDNFVSAVENKEDVIRYGTLGDYAKDMTTEEAKLKLSGVERKITLTNFGDSQYWTGKSVLVTEPYTGLIGAFDIDSDEHNWKNGIYTNKLVLRYKGDGNGQSR